MLKKLFGTLALLAVIAALAYAALNLRVEQIICTSQYGPCSDSIVERLENIEGQTLFSARSQIKNLFTNNSLVSEHSTQFKLPRKLLINILESRAQYALKGSGNSWIAHVASNGEVISLVEKTSFQVVDTLSSPPNPGEKIDSKTLFALKLSTELSNYQKLENATLEKDKLIAKLSSGETAIFPLEGDIQVLLGSLNLILSQLNGSADEFRIDQDISEIDLRFKNPVVK